MLVEILYRFRQNFDLINRTNYRNLKVITDLVSIRSDMGATIQTLVVQKQMSVVTKMTFSAFGLATTAVFKGTSHNRPVNTSIVCASH